MAYTCGYNYRTCWTDSIPVCSTAQYRLRSNAAKPFVTLDEYYNWDGVDTKYVETFDEAENTKYVDSFDEANEDQLTS